MSRADCLANWPGAESGAYHPSCCRFPKSCSIDAPVPGPAEEPDREALRVAVVARVLYDSHGTCVGECCRPDLRRNVVDARAILAALLPTLSAPGGGGTDLRGEVERLCDEAKPHWSAAGPGVPMVTVESLRAALAARDADQGAGALAEVAARSFYSPAGRLVVLLDDVRAALARATPEAEEGHRG